MKPKNNSVDAVIASLNWGRTEKIEGPQGIKDICRAPANKEFWELWQTAKDNCKAAGLHALKTPAGDWVVELTKQSPTTAATSEPHPVIPEATPKATEKAASEATPEAAPEETAAEATKEAAKETTPEKAAENVVENAPEAAPKAAPEATPKNVAKSAIELATGAQGPMPELAVLLGLIRDFLLRFLVFTSPEHPVVIALWVAHTWVFKTFYYTPYLHITSPTSGCGKTLLLDCLNALTCRPWLIVRGSDAAIMQTIHFDSPTVLYDEIDTVFRSARDKSNEAQRAVFNAGFARGAKMPRCSGSGIVEYVLFCPKAFSGIGDSLPSTVKDRSIRIQLLRKAKDQIVEKFHWQDVEGPTKLIADELSSWASDEDVLEKLRAARPAIPDELADRAADISEPLLAIADEAGGEWPQAARAALVALLRVNSEEHDEPGVKLLAAIRDVFAAAGKKQLPTAVILRELSNRDEEEAWTTQWLRAINSGNTRGPAARMAALLKPFGVSGGTIRVGDASTPKGYRIEVFADAFSRYLPDLPPAEKDATTPRGLSDTDTPTSGTPSENGEESPQNN